MNINKYISSLLEDAAELLVMNENDTDNLKQKELEDKVKEAETKVNLAKYNGGNIAKAKDDLALAKYRLNQYSGKI